MKKQKENTTNKGGNFDQPNVKKSLLKWAAVKDEFEEFIGGVMLMIIVLIYFKD